MASTLVSAAAIVKTWQSYSELPRYGALDDIAAIAVVAALSVLYLFKGVLWNRPDPFMYKLYERPQEHLEAQTASQSTRNIALKLEQMVRASA